MIKKFDKIPKELEPYTDSELESSCFADDINGIFSINGVENILQSFELLKDIPYKAYSKADILYMLDRICHAAKEHDINLDDVFESLGGEIMSVDKNSQEFQEALALEVKKETDKLMADLVDKNKNAQAMKELNDKLNESQVFADKLKKENDVLKAEKEDLQKAFSEYKADVEVKAKIRERIDALKSVGLQLEDWAKTEEAVAEMSDRVFELYKEQVIETIKAAKAKPTPEELEKMKEEEEKKKKKAKANDIVVESKTEGTLPNGNIEISGDKFPTLTKAFAKMRNERS